MSNGDGRCLLEDAFERTLAAASVSCRIVGWFVGEIDFVGHASRWEPGADAPSYLRDDTRAYIYVGDRVFIPNFEGQGWTEIRSEPGDDPRLEGLGLLTPVLAPFAHPDDWQIDVRTEMSLTRFEATGPLVDAMGGTIPGRSRILQAAVEFMLDDQGRVGRIVEKRGPRSESPVPSSPTAYELYGYGVPVAIQPPDIEQIDEVVDENELTRGGEESQPPEESPHLPPS